MEFTKLRLVESPVNFSARKIMNEQEAQEINLANLLETESELATEKERHKLLREAMGNVEDRLVKAEAERDELQLKLYGKDPTAEEIAAFLASDPKLSPTDEAALEKARLSFPYALKEVQLRIKAEAENAELKRVQKATEDVWRGAEKELTQCRADGERVATLAMDWQKACDQLRAEVEQAKEAHRLQAANYTKLHDAVIGEGTSVGWPDPVEVAASLRARNALLEKVVEAARGFYTFNQYGMASWQAARDKLKTALTAYDLAEK